MLLIDAGIVLISVIGHLICFMSCWHFVDGVFCPGASLRTSFLFQTLLLSLLFSPSYVLTGAAGGDLGLLQLSDRALLQVAVLLLYHGHGFFLLFDWGVAPNIVHHGIRELL